jgi:DEAD/DEAH box helicase domain-containing protein
LKKNLQDILNDLKINNDLKENIVTWRTLEEKPAKTMSLPEDLNPSLQEALKKKGVEQLYTHQKSAYEAVMQGSSIVAVTPTASGKTLCYNLPVLQTILSNPNARALYMFPTKALAQDQKSEINEIIQAAGLGINSYTYE